MSLTLTRPDSTEHAPHYSKYVALVGEDDILSVLRSQIEEMRQFLSSVDESQANMLHPPYTWTLKQVVGHLNDGERIFAYRALRIARGDATPLPGFDENAYAKAGEFSHLRLRALAREFEVIRRSTLSLLENLDASSWSKRGEANGSPVSVRAVAFIMAGHVRHHLAIMKKRLGANRVCA